MKRVIFDTNIYGILVSMAEISLVHERMQDIMVNYGSVVVKQEIKAYHGGAKLSYEGKVRKLRALLLEAYDLLVRRTYQLDEKTDRLAEEYFIAYTKLGGTCARAEIINDFLIVATAALHDLIIIFTEEKVLGATMRSRESMKAYDIVNEMNGLKTPSFRSYDELKKELKRWSA